MYEVTSLEAIKNVSTHSHPKVAAHHAPFMHKQIKVSKHSHPKGAAFGSLLLTVALVVSTHSHPKVAAPYIKKQEKSAN